MLLAVSHGLSIGGLLALLGMLYQRHQTLQIGELGGLARQTPRLAFFMLVLILSSIGLPGLSGFAGELLLLTGAVQRGWTGAPPDWALHYRVIAVAATAGAVLGAWYMLSMAQRVLFGPVRRPQRNSSSDAVADLNLRESLALAPLVVLIFWIGLQPQVFLDRMSPTLDRLTVRAMQAADGEEPGFDGQGGLARVD